MLSFIGHKGNCTGCSSCMAACPVHCISMKVDEEGFWYPESSDLCIECGMCEKVCPVINHAEVENKGKHNSYAYLSYDKEIWQRSASGGAFSDICKAWSDTETIIVGAAWDGLRVHQVCVKGVENIAPLCKSKYVASFPEDTFSEIKQYLITGKKVIFCGTPCQVSGLKLFLRKNYENLLTIDLICHGIGSPRVFQECMQFLENKYHDEVIEYTFRAKRKNKYEQDYLTFIHLKNKALYIKNDIYTSLFLRQLCLRPSCGSHCKFRNENRQGDITIADYKGLLEYFPEFKKYNHNFSSVITNNRKGEEMIINLDKSGILRECPIDNIKKHNPLFYRHTWFAVDRDKFFASFINNPQKALKDWEDKKTFKQIIIEYMPKPLLSFLLRVLKK